jgi:putative PIN family toxin of toxin-antitoxin system
LEEIRDVLFRKKFDFIDSSKKNEFILLLSQLAEIVYPRHKVDICRDKKDNKFIELALTAKVKIIVSGDNDLLSIKEYMGIKILSANEFLKMLENIE